MSITPELWNERLCDLLRELSNADYQRRVWVRGEGPEVSSWEEASCMFDDVIDPQGFLDSHWERMGLSYEQYKRVAQVRDAIDAYEPQTSAPLPADIVDDPAWDTVRRLAQSALDAL